MCNFLIEAVEERHGEGRVEDEYDGVEDDLIPDGNIPVRYKIRVFSHTIRIISQITIRNNVSYNRFERYR